MSGRDLAARAVTMTIAGRRVLDDVSARFPAGALTALIGPNGAGKTSLARCLGGLARPDSGEVLLGERPVAGLPRAERARAIAYLAQAGEVAWPMTVEALVMLGRMPLGASLEHHGPADRAAVERALAQVDLAEAAARDVTRLSGGERARALLARALATGADVLIADEPVAAFDPGHQATVMEVLRDEARAGRVVVVVLHDLALAARFADRVVVMAGGRVRAEGAAEPILASPVVPETFGVSLLTLEHEGRRIVAVG